MGVRVLAASLLALCLMKTAAAQRAKPEGVHFGVGLAWAGAWGPSLSAEWADGRFMQGSLASAEGDHLLSVDLGWRTRADEWVAPYAGVGLIYLRDRDGASPVRPARESGRVGVRLPLGVQFRLASKQLAIGSQAVPTLLLGSHPASYLQGELYVRYLL